MYTRRYCLLSSCLVLTALRGYHGRKGGAGMKKARQGKGQTGNAADRAEAQGNASKPVSLSPLSFDEAIGGLLETDAEAVRELEREAAKKKAAKKAARGKG